MARFAYRAVDPEGRERKGRVSAPDAASARSGLEAKKWLVVDIGHIQERSTFAWPLTARHGLRMGSKQLMLFTRQLSSLMQVSPLEEAVGTIARQSERNDVRTVLGTVHQAVVEGQSLAEAMGQERRSFPPVYRAMVAAGENSGALPEIADKLADLLEKQAEIRSKIISALAYPLMLALVAMLVVSALMISVVPRIVAQFDQADRLPTITRIVIAVSDFLAGWWWVLAIIIGLALIGLWQGMKFPRFRRRFDAMWLRIPVIGRLTRDVNAARLARTLSTMVASRLPLLDGLQLTQKTVRNTVLRDAMEQIVERIRAGGSLSGALRAAGIFPPLLVYLAASGEASGRLEAMLERAADYLEREFETFTSSALSLLEPAIIVVMGGLVALIILAILLPILQLQNLTGF